MAIERTLETDDAFYTDVFLDYYQFAKTEKLCPYYNKKIFLLGNIHTI